jgi:glycogen operon protein
VERDIAWYGADGNEMPEQAWTTEWTRSMALMLNGKTLQVSDENGDPLKDDSFLMLINASHEGVEFTLPPVPNGSPWCQVMDTENVDDPFHEEKVGEKVIVGGRSMELFSDNAEVLRRLTEPEVTEFRTAEAPSSSRPS